MSPLPAGLARFNPLTIAEKITGRPMAASTRHFFKDSFFYSAANFVPRLMGLFMMPIITRRLASTGDYSTFNVYVSAITAICVIMSAQNELSVARYYYEDKADFPQFLGTQFFFTLGLSIIMFAQFWAFKGTWAWVFALPVPVFLCAVVTSMAQILHQVYFQLLLAKKKSLSFFNYSMAKNVIYVVVGIALLFIMTRQRAYLGLVYAHLISTVLIGVIFLYFLLRMMKPAFHWHHLRYALRLTIPGIPGALALFALNFFDRIYLQHQSRNLAGQYTFAYNIGMLILMLTSGVFSAYMPRFYENMNKAQHGAIQQLFARNLNLLLLAAGGLILLSKPVAMILGKPAYFGSLPIIPIIITGYIFMYLGQCYGLYVAYRRKFIFLQSISLIVAGVANIYLNIWLLPIFHNDTRVAALNTLIPYLIQWLAVLWISKYLLKEKVVSFKGAWLALTVYLTFAASWCLFGY